MKMRTEKPHELFSGSDLPYHCVLRGRTGSGKTSILNALASLGSQVLDLEQLARHRGSAFGNLGMPDQPSNAEFLQRLYVHWQAFDSTQPLFVEFSGSYLGSVTIPRELAKQIDRADWIQLVASETQRTATILTNYANAGQNRLLAATRRLRGRFPPRSLAQVRKAIRQQRLNDAVHLLLPYYDAAYDHQREIADGRCLFKVDVDGRSPHTIATTILKKLEPSLSDHATNG